MHQQPAFAHCRVRGGTVADEIFSRGLCLPSGTGLKEADLERIVKILRDVGVHAGHSLTSLSQPRTSE